MQAMKNLKTQMKIILIYVNDASFIREDESILSEFCQVDRYSFRMSKRLFPFVIEFCKLLYFSIFKIPSYDIVYCWFADYHSLLPVIMGRLYRKKSVIAVGGYDAVSIPSIKFGAFYKNNFRAFCAKFSLKFAHYIFPVDQSLICGINVYADPVGIGYSIGINHFVKKIYGTIYLLPTGYDPDKWKRNDDIDRNRSVITVAGARDKTQYLRKGLDLYIKIAELLPETDFFIVGLKGEMEEYARQNAPTNVIFLGYLSHIELPDELSKHKVFAQFSLSEGLPNTLCEAMLCECIPVGSNVNGIPEAIGECGFVLEKKDPVLAATLISKALQADSSLGRAARERIITKYPKNKRRETLLKLLKED